MKIDLFVLTSLLLFGLHGLWRGAARQLAHVGALVAGWLASQPLSAIAAPMVVERYKTPYLMTAIACSFGAFFLVYLVSNFLLRAVIVRVLPEGENGFMNRVAGFLFGATKATIILFIVLSLAAWARKSVAAVWPAFAQESKSSLAMKFVKDHGPLAAAPAMEGLEKLLKGMKDPAFVKRLSENADFAPLTSDPRVRSAALEANVQKAFAEGDPSGLMSSWKVLELLKDPKLVQLLQKLSVSREIEMDAEGVRAPATSQR